MSEIKIDVKRTGFPVKFGKIELWFDSSAENLRNFLNIEEVAQKRLKEVQEKVRDAHFPSDLEDVENIDTKTIDAALDYQKEFVAIQYDILFGDGTFKKIYKEYPDIFALEKYLDPLGLAIAEKIEEQEKDRSAFFEEMRKEALKKKKAKRK